MSQNVTSDFDNKRLCVRRRKHYGRINEMLNRMILVWFLCVFEGVDVIIVRLLTDGNWSIQKIALNGSFISSFSQQTLIESHI